jgi:hypothetical protein
MEATETKPAAPTKKLWAVEMTRSATVYVVAESFCDAMEVAENEASDEVDEAPIECSPREVREGGYVALGEDDPLYGTDDDLTYGDWKRCGGDVDGFRARRAADAEARGAAWFAAAPSDIRDLPAWHVARPESLKLTETQPQGPWGFTTPDGRTGATDGSALLAIVDGNPPPCTREGWTDPVQSGRSVDRLFEVHERHAPISGTTTAGKVREWLMSRGERQMVRVGPASLAAALADAWVRPSLGADDQIVRISWGGDLDPVCFAGAGWKALVAPQRMHGGEDRGPELEVTP